MKIDTCPSCGKIDDVDSSTRLCWDCTCKKINEAVAVAAQIPTYEIQMKTSTSGSDTGVFVIFIGSVGADLCPCCGR